MAADHQVATLTLSAVRQQAEPFLRALFGDFYSRGLQGFIELRVIGPDGVRSRFFSSIEAVLDALPELKAVNDAGANI